MILNHRQQLKLFRVLLSKNKRVERLSFFIVWFRRMTSKSHFFQIFFFVKFFSVSQFSTGSHFQMTNCGDVKFSNELRFSWSCNSTSCAPPASNFKAAGAANFCQILFMIKLGTFVKFLYINIFPFYYNMIYFLNQIFIALQTLPRSRKICKSIIIQV